MPNVPLPPCPDHYHLQPSSHHRTSRSLPCVAPRHSPPTPLDGLLTPLSSPPCIHPALSTALTVVCYNLACNPQTIHMSSSPQYPFFPSHDPVLSPSASVLYVRCEATGQMIMVEVCKGAVTCLDLMVQLHHYFDGEIVEEEWQDVRGGRRSAMKKAYKQRTGPAYSASAHMKRVDYLLGRTMFERIVPQYGDSTQWLLQTC